MTPEEERSLAIAELRRVEQIKSEYLSASNAQCKQLIEELKGMKTLDTSDLIEDIEQEMTRDGIRHLTLDEQEQRSLRDGQEYGIGFDLH